jgi:hypothetical protein
MSKQRDLSIKRQGTVGMAETLEQPAPEKPGASGNKDALSPQLLP